MIRIHETCLPRKTKRMSVKYIILNVTAIIALLIGNIVHADIGQHIEVRISDLGANPDKYVNQKLSIVGLIDDICPAAGCWASIKDPGVKDVVRFKVPDGKLVFTAEMLGDEVTAHGLFRKHTLENTAARRWLAHLALERGEVPGEAELNHEGSLNVYQLEGTEAELSCSEHHLVPTT